MTKMFAVLWLLQGVTAVGSPVPGVHLGVSGQLGASDGIVRASVQLMSVGGQVEPVPVAWVRMRIEGRMAEVPMVCAGDEWREVEVLGVSALLVLGLAASIEDDCAWAAHLHPAWEALRPYMERPLEVQVRALERRVA